MYTRRLEQDKDTCISPKKRMLFQVTLLLDWLYLFIQSSKVIFQGGYLEMNPQCMAGFSGSASGIL